MSDLREARRHDGLGSARVALPAEHGKSGRLPSVPGVLRGSWDPLRFGFAARPPRGRRARHCVGRRLNLAALPGAEAANNNATAPCAKPMVNVTGREDLQVVVSRSAGMMLARPTQHAPCGGLGWDDLM